MPSANESPGARLRAQWARLSPLPGGKWLFSRLLAYMIPYTGALGAKVVHFEPGSVRVQLRDRRGIRNHLKSVHAIALANLGEFTTGLAMIGALPSTVRGIITGLEVSYSKKARGLLVAEANCEIPEVTEPRDYPVQATVRDEEGDVVATITALWRLGPTPPKGGAR